VSGARGVYAPDKIKDLIEFFRSLGRDNSRFIILERGTRS